jgi:hypothetical protein
MRCEGRVPDADEEDLRRQPSIELAPSMERPVFIITRQLNGRHILALTEQFDKHRVAYQMQQDTATLGFRLTQRFFVVVDNAQGEVLLGPEFASILMTVVGYPRRGSNKQNRYFEHPPEILAYYQQFRNDQDLSRRQKSLIASQYSDVVLERGSSSRISPRVAVRSISKHRPPENKEQLSSNAGRENLNRELQHLHLLVLED